MKLFNTYELTYQGEQFERGGITYQFEKQIKADKFKYIPVSVSAEVEAQEKQAAAERKIWDLYLDELYLRLTCREVAKAINKAYKGKLAGSSRTTEATYGALNCGKTYRVAKHDAYTRRSLRNDILVTFEEGIIKVEEEEIEVSLHETPESVTARIVAAFGKVLN
jgi:hypothetical protein